MNKEEILAKSRAENKNVDVYELEILKQAGQSAAIVMRILALLFFGTQLFVGGGANWGLIAVVHSSDMMTYWVKYSKLRHKRDLAIAIVNTIFVFVVSGWHIYHLMKSSTIL